MADKEAQTAVEAAPEELTLEEFCRRHSMSDRRVELLGGFHFAEKSAGHAKDLESNYLDRFEAFANKPV
jgi:hypothetical protein